MAYVRPGVEVTQRQTTVSPTLIEPDLPAVVIGPAYRVVEISDRSTSFTHDYATRLTASGTTIALFSGVSFSTSSLQDIDADTLYVDVTGSNSNVIGQTLHIPPGHGSLQLTSNSLTITKTLLSGITSTPDYWVSGYVKVGWRALDPGLVGQCLLVESVTDVESAVGKRIPENPAAFGLNLAISAGNTAAYVVATSGTASEDHADAIEVISSQEIYAIAPVVMLSTSDAAVYGTHVTSASSATEKLERIVFPCISRTFTADKAADADTIAQANLSLANKRVFAVHPPAGYYAAKRHISTLYPSYLDGMNGDLGLYAILDEKVTTASGTVYFKGQEINTAVWSGIAGVQTYVNALVPVPGAYWSAIAAGDVAGVPPQQGHTNMPMGGLNRVKYSSDYFSQSQLNTMATGGTFIISQTVPSAAPACRHQLSTDMNSVETRELNITKSLDFVSKFLRLGLRGYIGRYNITPRFLKLMEMTFNGMKNYLIRNEYVVDMRLLSLEQSTTERDVILVNLEIAPAYPVNYIRITLTF